MFMLYRVNILKSILKSREILKKLHVSGGFSKFRKRIYLIMRILYIDYNIYIIWIEI
jgi:hypothetical protein